MFSTGLIFLRVVKTCSISLLRKRIYVSLGFGDIVLYLGSRILSERT